MIFKTTEFASNKWKGVISEKIKAKTCFADKDLSSWTGLGRSGHVQITTFGPIWHVSGSKLTLWCHFQMVLHVFSSRS